MQLGVMEGFFWGDESVLKLDRSNYCLHSSANSLKLTELSGAKMKVKTPVSESLACGKEKEESTDSRQPRWQHTA